MSKLHDLIHERFLFVSLLLFIFSSLVAFALEAETKKIIAVTIETFGILIGIIFLVFMVNVIKSFRGSLRKSFNYIAYGAIFQILSLAYTLVFLRFNFFPVPLNLDIHHLLMVVGIVFFTIGILKLKSMVAELK